MNQGNQIPLEVILKGLGIAEKDLDNFAKKLQKNLLSHLDKINGTDYFKNIVGGVKELTELFRTLGVSVQRMGRNLTLSMTDINGVTSSVSGVLKGGTIVHNSDTQSYRVNSVTQELVYNYGKVISLQKELNRLILEGDTSSEYYKTIEKSLNSYRDSLKETIDKNQELINGGDELAARTYRQYKHQEEAIEKLLQKKQEEKAENEKQKQENQQVQQYISLLQQEKNALIQLENLKKKVGSSPNAQQKQAISSQQQYTQELTRQRQALEQNVRGTNAYKQAQGQIALVTKKAAAEQAKQAVETQKTTSLLGNFGNIFKTVFSSGASWIVFSIIRQGISGIKDNVIELDKSLVDLQIVTNKSRSATKDLLDTYNQMAVELGTTTQAVAESATTWLRQGYSIAETNELIKQSQILSKVGMIESADATKYLTSAIKGYKLEVEDASAVTDMATAIDMNAAVSSGELYEALSKTANLARTSGIEINQAFGMIAAGIEVTQQDASSFGTSLKSLFSRMSKVAAGATVDDMGEAVNDVEKVLQAQGIALRDSANQWRDYWDVLSDISDKMKSGELSGVELSQVTTALGGKQKPCASTYSNIWCLAV